MQDAEPCMACHEPVYLRLDGMPNHTTRQCAPVPAGRLQGFGWCSACGQRFVHVDLQGRLLCRACGLQESVDGGATEEQGP